MGLGGAMVSKTPPDLPMSIRKLYERKIKYVRKKTGEAFSQQNLGKNV